MMGVRAGEPLEADQLDIHMERLYVKKDGCRTDT